MVAKFKQQGLTMDGALQAIRLPVMDNVFTAHPTFIGDLEYTKKLRDVNLKIHNGKDDEAAQGLGDLLTMPSVVDTTMGVADETSMMRHFLANAYQSVRFIYENLDKAMEESGLAGEYDPFEAKLQLKFQSWGSSGDKDGNKNVNYLTTEDAVKTHRKTIAHFYQGDLLNIFQELPEELRKQHDEQWQKIHEQLDEISQNPFGVSQQNIETVSDNLKAFAKELYTVTHEREDTKKAQALALGLLRRVDIFGMAMGDIEYREDAGQNKKVLNFLITKEDIQAVDLDAESYLAIESSEDRAIVLNHFFAQLDDPEQKNVIQARLNHQLRLLDREVKTRYHNYATDEGLFYNTIKRLQLANRHPDMIHGQVLAEAQSPTEFKEMLALLKLTGNDKHMRVVPLFEDPEVLKDVGTIMNTIQRDPDIYHYLVTLSLNEWKKRAEKGYVPALPEAIEKAITRLPAMIQSREFEEECQVIDHMIAEDETLKLGGVKLELSDIIQNQIQLAHSDNSRRGGIVGARAGIYKAHDAARKQAASLHMGMQFFEGGSHTDAFRMGTRSYRSLVNTYSNHDFMKSTVQGMDLAQLFSDPYTIESFLGDNIGNAAAVAYAKRQARGKEYLVSSRHPEQAVPAPHVMDKGQLLDPFIAQIEHYQSEFFEYDRNKKAGTQGSRAAGRDASKEEATLSEEQKKALHQKKLEELDAPYIDPVKGTRTIGYSETMQHAGLNPNFIGVRNLRHDLLNSPLLQGEAGENPSGSLMKLVVDLFGKPEEKKLNTLYLGNPGVHDILDRVAYAVATTDFDEVWDRAKHVPGRKSAGVVAFRSEHQLDYGESQEVGERPAKEELEELAKEQKTVKGFIAGLELEYRGAAKMTLEAIKGEKVDIDDLETHVLRNMVKHELKAYRDHFATMDVAMAVAKKIDISTDSAELSRAISKDGNPNNAVKNSIDKMLHAVRDMATLVRPPFQNELHNRGVKQGQAQGMGIA
jgi:hypothetical protein